jgi:hypothetical protein
MTAKWVVLGLLTASLAFAQNPISLKLDNVNVDFPGNATCTESGSVSQKTVTSNGFSFSFALACIGTSVK